MSNEKNMTESAKEVKEKAINKGREIMENETIKKFSRNSIVKKFLKTPKFRNPDLPEV